MSHRGMHENCRCNTQEVLFFGRTQVRKIYIRLFHLKSVKKNLKKNYVYRTKMIHGNKTNQLSKHIKKKKHKLNLLSQKYLKDKFLRLSTNIPQMGC